MRGFAKQQSALPTRQKVAQRLLHFIERAGAKQDRLVMRRVVNVARRDFQIEWQQPRFVHLRQLTRRRQQARAVSLDLSVLTQHAQLDREPVNTREAVEFIGRFGAADGFAKQPIDLREARARSEEHTSELQSPCNLVCRLLLEKKKKTT